MPEQKIYLLTGPVQTGKTTSLINWSIKRNDVFGILTPVVDGKRVFMNAHTREQFPMEATGGETETQKVGRFIFSKTNFNRAVQVILDAMNTSGWLAIDEIGPLELRGEGFCSALKEVLQDRRKGRIILVIREGIQEKVREYFNIKEAAEINDIPGLSQSR
ncbi:MAG: nucleoside-triphosphatase [Bacteroidota bacterium]|nr:nucleoside-triphosphatase [Bacteroidota bacterium]